MGWTTPPTVAEGDSFDETTWNTYIRDNMEFVFAPNVAAFGYNNPQTWGAPAGPFAFAPYVTQYYYVGIGYDWPYVNNQIRIDDNTNYLAHCGFTWTVTAGAISEVGFEVVSGTAPTLGGAFTFGTVGAAAYDRGGVGYPSSVLTSGTLAASGGFVSSSSNSAVTIYLCATGISSFTLSFTNIYLSLKKLKQA